MTTDTAIAPAPIDDTFRRIRNILDAYPATDWSPNEARDVLAALSVLVRGRQAPAAAHCNEAPYVVENPMPLVECAPWCTHGDGHPNEAAAEDQACWSKDDYVDLSLHTENENDGQSVGVVARRSEGQSVVYIHLREIKQPYKGIPYPYNYLDMSLRLTIEEAQHLAGALLGTVKLVNE